MSENMGMKRLTIQDIESKQFRRGAYGYEQREVDEFLDSICDEMELLLSEKDELQRKLDYANAQTRKAEAAGGVVSAPGSMSDASFREILEMAMRVKEQTIADAKTRAEEIVSEAQAKAEAELGSLKKERDDLQEKIDQLRDAAREYRAAMTRLLATHQESLDQLDLGE